MNIHSTWRFVRELSALGGFDDDLEAELHIKNIKKYVAHQEYYGRLPFKREIEVRCFVSLLRAVGYNYNTRFFAYKRCAEAYTDLVGRLYGAVKAELDSFGDLSQVLGLSGIIVTANKGHGNFDTKFLLDRLAQAFKAHDKELKLGEINALLDVHSSEAFLDGADLDRVQRSISTILKEKTPALSSNNLLLLAVNLHAIGRSDERLLSLLRDSDDLLLLRVDDSRDMHKFLRNAAALLQLGIASSNQLDLINQTLISNGGLAGVNSVLFYSEIAKADQLSPEAKTALKERLKQIIMAEPLRYDLTNPQVQGVIKLDE